MLSGRDRRCKLLARQKSSQWHTRSNRLGNRDNVGHNTKNLEGEQRPGAAESTLNLVKDERCLVLIGERATFAQEIRRTFQDSAFAKDGLKHDGAGVAVDGFTQSRDVVLRNKGYVFKQRLETFAMLLLAG